MASKIGAGGKPQEYDESTGRYGDSPDYTGKGKEYRQNTPYEEILGKDTIPLPDETLPRSVGARWANYDIQMPDGSVAHFQEGSKLHHKEVFAGKGCKRKIDQVDMLVERYGGKAEEWQKVKAIGTIVKENGEIEEVEVHWYEEPTVGKINLKYKRLK